MELLKRKVFGMVELVIKGIKIKGNKIYSKDTCIFVTGFINNGEAHKTGLTYRATKKSTGHTEIFHSQAQFAKDNKLDVQYVNKCLAGKYKQYKGWYFETVGKRITGIKGK